MVQKHRSASKATIAKDVSPMRNMEINKQAFTATAANFCDRLNVPAATITSASGSSSYNNADKWKYNNMVNNNREAFNSLHFC